MRLATIGRPRIPLEEEKNPASTSPPSPLVGMGKKEKYKKGKSNVSTIQVFLWYIGPNLTHLTLAPHGRELHNGAKGS